MLNASSWHGLEELGVFTDAASMIAHGRRTGALPAKLDFAALRTPCGLEARKRAVLAYYEAHAARVVGEVGDRYTALSPEGMAGLIEAAVQAGGLPTGVFSLDDGRKIVATFEVGQRTDGISTQLLISDSFDGSTSLKVGKTSVRVVCANTLARAFSQDGRGMAKLAHTASLSEQVQILRGEMASALKSSETFCALYRKASDTILTREAAKVAFDALFPEAPEGASKALVTKLENARHDARKAATLAINQVGAQRGNLATLWNAATYLVDREANGRPRSARGGAEALDSLLNGQRGRRVDEILNVVEVIMRDGSVQQMAVPEFAQRESAKNDFAALLAGPARLSFAHSMSAAE